MFQPKPSMNERNQEVCEHLEDFIRPQTFPLAIRMVKAGEVIEGSFKRPWRDIGIRVAMCQAFGIARRYGWSLRLEREDLTCPLNLIAFGFEEAPEEYLQGCACEGMYTETREAGQRTESLVAHWPFGEYTAVVVGPLRRTHFAPDVVLVFGTPGQMLRLVTGALWKSGGYLQSRFSGRLDCSDQVIHTMKTGTCQLILPCYGDRVFGHTEDHEMAFSIPYGVIDNLLEGLEGTQKGGIRYPIPAFLRFTPQFPPSYQQIEKKFTSSHSKRGETEKDSET